MKPTPHKSTRAISDTGPAKSFSNQRRRKLTSLSAEIDESTKAERQRGVRALLFHAIIISQSGDNELFSIVRRHNEWLKEWFAHYTGWS